MRGRRAGMHTRQDQGQKAENDCKRSHDALASPIWQRGIVCIVTCGRGAHLAATAPGIVIWPGWKRSGLEARGFILGAAVAVQLGVGFVPVRKPGKPPVPTLSMDHHLEYGADRLEIDPGAIERGRRVMLVDDLIATRGTARAAAELLRQAGALVESAAFLIDLPIWAEPHRSPRSVSKRTRSRRFPGIDARLASMASARQLEQRQFAGIA